MTSLRLKPAVGEGRLMVNEARRAMETKTNYGRVLAGLIVGWFAAVLIVSALHGFATNPNGPPLTLLAGVLAPIAAVLIWYRSSARFRAYLLGLNTNTLTLVHSWRVVGFVFLVLSAYGVLPKYFALPAGWGDIAIGATALPVAIWLAKPERKASFVAWQTLGVADLVLAISLGALSRVIDPHGTGITTAPMTVLPLSLIPGFAVPLLLILHGICIAQATRWKSDARIPVTVKRQPAL